MALGFGVCWERRGWGRMSDGQLVGRSGRNVDGNLWAIGIVRVWDNLCWAGLGRRFEVGKMWG